MSYLINHIFIFNEKFKRCGVCSYYMPLYRFGERKKAFDGLSNMCKNCTALIAQKKLIEKNDNSSYQYRGKYEKYIPGKTMIRRKGNIIKTFSYLFILGVSYKKCSRCLYYKTLNKFNNNKSTPDRKHTICKECVRKRTGRPRGRPIGWVMPEEVKEKIRQSALGKTLSYEHKNKIRKKMIGNTNRRTNFDKLTDDLYSDYVHTYKDENLGIWITENKEALEKSDIKTKHQLGSMAVRDVSLFELPDNGIIGINPESLLILKEELEEL